MTSKEILTNLLIDLYTAYNPDNINLVPEVVERYNEMAYVAVDAIFLKYNKKTASFYNPEYDKPEFKIQLLQDYATGTRTFQGKKFINEVKPTEIDYVKEEFNKAIKDLKPEVIHTETSPFDGLDIQVSCDYNEQVSFPDKKILIGLGVGSRIVTKSESGKIIGFIISDILYITGDKPIISITIEKG